MIETHAASFFSPDNVAVMIVIFMLLVMVSIVVIGIYTAGAADRRKQDTFEHLRADKELQIAKISAETKIQVAQIKAAGDVKVAELDSVRPKEIE